jgi:serine/threonine protein kinase
MTPTQQSPIAGLSEIAAGLWPHELPDDLRAYLDQNPHVRQDKAGVLDLAVEAYCRQVEAGERPDPDEFCARFPTYAKSLRAAIQAYDYLRDNLSLLDEERGPIAWPVEGETFLGFRLRRELGRGAFARVFLAEEPALGERRVAVKISPHGGAEAQTLGRIDHPNVVKVHAVRTDQASGLTAVCMPYLGGATLESVVATFHTGRPRRAHAILDAARGALDPEAAPGDWPAPHPLLATGSYEEGVCLLGAQLAEALAFLHSRRIYHRDLKPSNVLLVPDGTPMLLDFNLSADPRAERERFGGTLPYMAPEQVLAAFVQGGSAAPAMDGRCDLFALGVILFQLLTGRHPFDAAPRGKPSMEDCRAFLAQQQRGAPDVRSLCPTASPALASLVARCLAFEPEWRPREAGEVARALRQQLAPQACGRRRAWWLIAGILVVALGGGTPLYLAARSAPAVVGTPDRAEGLFVSGLRSQRQGEMSLAIDDFRKALAIAPDPQASASLAYCLAIRGSGRDYADSIVCGQQAVQNGLNTPAIRNNLAYCQMKDGQRPQARTILEELLVSSPRLPAVQHNHLVLLRLELRMKDRRRLPEARTALRDALKVCPESPELFGDAADLCAVAGGLEPGWDENALTYLEKALALGLPLGDRPTAADYKRLCRHPRFVALKNAPAEPAPPTPTGRLLDPALNR